MPPTDITVTQDETFTGGLCLGRHGAGEQRHRSRANRPGT
jgi:hypothetical protein